MLPGYQLPRRTRLACQVLQWFTLGVALVYAGYFFTEYGAEQIIDRYWNNLPDDLRNLVTYTTLKRALVYTIAIWSWLGSLLILLGAWRLFMALSKGEPFTLSVVKSIRFLGIMVLAGLVISFSIEPLMLGALTYDNPPGSRLLRFSATTWHARQLMLGGLFLILGHIFTEAVRISDESREIV